MIGFQYISAKEDKIVFSTLKGADTKLIAGGSNLVDLMKKGIENPQRLIDINRLEYRDISIKKNILHIGALALNSTVCEDELVLMHHPLLAKALKAGASQQIRNVATVGGNMMQRTRCSYFYNPDMACNKRELGAGCSAKEGFNRMHAIFGTSENCIAVHPSDMCVALAALDATVLIKNVRGNRRIPFSEFHRLPEERPDIDTNLRDGEMIIGIEIPMNNFQKHHYYLKHRDRASYAFAVVSVAVGLEIDNGVIKDARIAMGGVAHKPWRLLESEDFLKGKDATLENFQQAATLAMKGATSFGHNDFKLLLTPKAIVEALKSAALT